MIIEESGVWVFFKSLDTKLRASETNERACGPNSIFTNGYEVYTLRTDCAIIIYSDGEILTHDRQLTWSLRSPGGPL